MYMCVCVYVYVCIIYIINVKKIIHRKLNNVLDSFQAFEHKFKPTPYHIYIYFIINLSLFFNLFTDEKTDFTQVYTTG